ncbi:MULTISPECIES: hypothetical protein [Methylosinus]|uniref:Uncharacterized protein n=1 Tax=Methylosinus trichosporium (strain ATCC 35070 / NCIMB 11131 / UNIQEM 75 / OB3b) TaxID=595536 RepID=A0A2D2CVW7_METT3|nr:MULTISPECIES: hypothetical protein [Methylosinus]ATQ66789.1 hypothetical protein CQW49_01930 [Methylosinus trichosporium OB3b]OBS54192.1 hypothetical protein A8B73_01935 [Methylosinus sp. 3S-1]
MTATFLLATALLGVLAGAVLLYGGTSRQNLLPRSLAAAPSLLGAAVFLLVAGAALQPLMAPLTAFFTELVLLMTLLIALPIVAALRKGRGR